MNLSDVKNALLTVSTRVYRYTAPATPAFPYIIWQDEMESDMFCGDGRKLFKTMEGSVDLYTKTADCPFIDKIEKALNDAGICFRLNSVQFEPTTRIIHHEWVWNIETEVP